MRRRWQSLTETEKRKHLESLTNREIDAINWWMVEYARDSQLPPDGDDWEGWLCLTGRGFGKTRTGAETTDEFARSGEVEFIHLVAATAADARDVMVEGESGLLAVAKPGFMPQYEPSKRRVTWANGCVATLFSAEEPKRLRGPQCGFAWSDETAFWQYDEATWDNLQFGARLGKFVRQIVTTTPRPTKLIKSLIANPKWRVTRGSMYENIANLAPSFIEAIKSRYEGTRLGRQEIGGEILEDNPDALWKRSWIERDRLVRVPEGIELSRVVVAVDPSITTTGDEAGIQVQARGSDNNFYQIEDCSLQGSPDAWGRAAVTAYHKHHADLLVYESNQGGEMVKSLIRNIDRTVNTKGVHASRGKVTRAEPTAALSEQSKIKFVGSFPRLEDELCEWTAGSPDSPNRLDAFVWGMTELAGKIVPGFVDRKAIGV